MNTYSKTARCTAWGSDKNARRVSHLTPEERTMVRSGQDVRLAGCPEYQGQTDRLIVAIGSRFFCRMPT